jgi:hypothetical protein
MIIRQRIAAPLGALLFFVALTPLAGAAAGPAVMMFRGPMLKQPILITGINTSPFVDLGVRSEVAASDLTDRPYVDVAIFWQDPIGSTGKALSDLKPEMAWQHGRYYPATSKLTALLLTTQVTKREQPVPTAKTLFPFGGPLSDAAVAVLAKAGLPTSVKLVTRR